MSKDFSFRAEMAENVKWLGIAQLIMYLLQFIVWVILARLLPPSEFGALGIALAFTNFVLVFGELGMSTAIIQRKELTSGHLSTTFWITIFINGSFLLIAFLIAPLLAKFYHNAGIPILIILLGVKLLIDAFAMVPEVLLKRDLQFKTLAMIEIFSGALFGIVAIVLAFRGWGIVAMAWGYLVKSVLRVVLLWQRGKFRPSFEFDRKSFAELFDYGKNIIGFKIMSFFAGNIDIFLIGKCLGSTALGYYAMALNLVNFPRHKISMMISQVAFPAFSKIQDYQSEIQQAYEKLIRYAAVISFPLLIGLMLLAPQFVRVCFGSKWEAIVLPLQILSVYGLVYSLTTFVGIIFNSTGHPEQSFYFSIITLVGTAVAVLLGLPFGLVGVVSGLSAFAFILNIWGQEIVNRLIGMNYQSYLRAMAPALLSSLAMATGLGILIVLYQKTGGTSARNFFILGTIIGAGIYFTSLYGTNKKTFNEIKGILQQMLKLKDKTS